MLTIVNVIADAIRCQVFPMIVKMCPLKTMNLYFLPTNIFGNPKSFSIVNSFPFSFGIWFILIIEENSLHKCITPTKNKKDSRLKRVPWLFFSGLKVSKSRKQFMVFSILPKDEQSLEDAQDSEFCSSFGRIENTIIFLRFTDL